MVAGWLLVLVAAVGLSRAVGAHFNSGFSLPNTDSQAAVTLLKANFPAAAGDSDQIVIQTSHGATVRSPAVKTAVSDALTTVARVPGVEAVASPYSGAGAAQISRDATVAFATVTWSTDASKVTTSGAHRLITAAETATGPDVSISLGGQSIADAQRSGVGLSVVVGVVAALAILLIVLGGAVWSSLLVLLSTMVALLIGTSAIELLSRVFDVPSASTDLAVLIGLGVGVDYGLFISRHRSGVKAGLSYEDATAQAVNTSGRTVVFAGLTVCIALLGQFALGVNFLYGLSASSAIAVALTLATSLTFLPAMLGFLGPKVLARRERRALRDGAIPTDVSTFWSGWARLVEGRRVLVVVGSLAAVVALALPILSLRLGSSDAGTDPSGSTTRWAYTALAEGFGPGFNGPLTLAGPVSSPAVTSPNGKVVLATLYPGSSPQAKDTVALVTTLRHRLIPRAEPGTALDVHVGGVTATNIDFSHVLTEKPPLFIAVVVLLAFLLLTAVFRSLLIPLVASVMNLLSIGAALGAMNAVFNWGWGGSIRYRPAGHRNHQAIVLGQAKSGRIIAAAATIMILVFGSFLLGGQRSLQEFGFGLGFSVLVDALVIRSLLIPAIMHLSGPANWSMPVWLDHILPNLSIEVDEPVVPEPEPLAVP